VEGRNQALGQWIGRTTCNRILNFSHPDTNGNDLAGKYLSVRVTRAGPNSLVGESGCSTVLGAVGRDMSQTRD
jgi:tRNA-2-methylthio-N6-dimethylallyladenosine synthase